LYRQELIFQMNQ